MAVANEKPNATHALKDAHHNLIVRYVEILKQVSSLRAIGGRGARQELYGRDLTVWRALVRIFVEHHIRRQLLALSGLYALQHGVALSRSSEEGRWLGEAEESCRKVLGATSSWPRLRLLLATATPIVGGLVIAVLGAEDVYGAAVKLATSEGFKAGSASLLSNYGVLTYFVAAIAYLLLPLVGSFSYKRGLFYPAARYQEAMKWKRRRLERRREKLNLPAFEQSENVYKLEDTLFGLLQVRKRRESRSDLVLSVCGLILALLAYFVYTFQVLVPGQVPSAVLTIIGISISVLCLVAMSRALYTARHRIWR